MIKPPRLAARLAAASALAGACGVLAACGATPAPGTAPTHTVTVQATGGASTSAAAAAATSSSSAPPAGPPGCLASGLQAQLGVSQGTAGTIYQVVVLTNTSSATCTLYGYPGVSFVSGIGGSQIGKPATKNPVVPKALVTLVPGGKADLLLAVHDAGAIQNCNITNVNWLRIYPPGDFGSLYVQYNTQACSNSSKSIMSVTPVRIGAGSASYEPRAARGVRWRQACSGGLLAAACRRRPVRGGLAGRRGRVRRVRPAGGK